MIRWLLLHKNVWVYVDNDSDWYVQFDTPCEKLTEDKLCAIYQNRPLICREYNQNECEKFGKGVVEKHVFRTAEAFEQWWQTNKN